MQVLPSHVTALQEVYVWQCCMQANLVLADTVVDPVPEAAVLVDSVKPHSKEEMNGKFH